MSCNSQNQKLFTEKIKILSPENHDEIFEKIQNSPQTFQCLISINKSQYILSDVFIYQDYIYLKPIDKNQKNNHLFAQIENCHTRIISTPDPASIHLTLKAESISIYFQIPMDWKSFSKHYFS